MFRTLRLVGFGFGAAILGGVALAHHSQAGIFDSRETVEVSGVIKTVS